MWFRARPMQKLTLELFPPNGCGRCKYIDSKSSAACRISRSGSNSRSQNLGLQRPPVETPADADVIQILAKSYQAVMKKEPKHAGYVAYTDAAPSFLYS